ncbi:hypothetical protein CSH63_17945 [Micromonospora tulbaghiae]|uniref:Uncharacterized protein n=1 Tax=Micromonospora tulbaghiae TaxID=479978 RepID=A0A386WMP1_9ACTN|nr:hypothetical protein [Micromonospora tulbaghiae]AYF29313.1 hypothetical protein CSH63_17945 [Micromonospora tulbaghiae]
MADPTEPTEPVDPRRAFARDLRAMHTALTDEGFTSDQAVTLLAQMIEPQPGRRRAHAELSDQERAARSARIADLLRTPKTTDPATPEGTARA